MSSVRAFARLLKSAPPYWVAALLLLMFFASLTESIGLLLLVPMLAVLGGDQGTDNPLVTGLVEFFQMTGLPLSVDGLLVAFFILITLRRAIQYARERLGASLQHQVVDAMRARCFSALLGVEWRWVAAGRKSDHAS